MDGISIAPPALRKARTAIPSALDQRLMVDVVHPREEGRTRGPPPPTGQQLTA